METMTKNINVALSAELYAKLEAIAEAWHRKKPDQIRFWIETTPVPARDDK